MSPMLLSQKLIDIVDIFKCCIFTWGAATTVLPAFFLAGAIATFAPISLITKFLGPKSNKWFSLPTASIIGQILPTCSCNIVPLFTSILKKGCGIGPAFTFLYAGPAINIISIAFVFKIIGPVLALWRMIGVFVVSITMGIIMSLLFKEDASRLRPSPCSGLRSKNTESQYCSSGVQNLVCEPSREQSESDTAIGLPKNKITTISFFIVLFLILTIGSTIGGLDPLQRIDKFVIHKIAIIMILSASILWLILKYFPKESILSWLDETWRLLKTIVPVLVVSILVIGLISAYIDIRWVHNMLSAQKDALGNRLFLPTLRSTFLATLFGELMYFPILTEVVFVKAFLKLGMDIGPALGILLAGPGTSLPGFILIYRYAGFRKLLAYFLISLIMETAIAVTLSMMMGDYLCACLLIK